MSAGRIWLGRSGIETLMPNMGRQFSEEDTEIAKEDRTASGRLVTDVIAVKKLFTLDYNDVTDDILTTLKTVYAIGGALSIKVERENGSIDAYSVRMRPFGRKRVLMANQWLWGGIGIKLEEI